MPQNRTELKESIALLREHNVPYLVIGNGSNLLVGDGGIRGAVIQLYQRMQHISVDGTEMTLDCGALLSAAAAQAADASLEGLAFASGIPGTFGGAVVMNAGAYGGEMKDVLLSADVLTEDLEVKTIPVEELDLSYRHSIVPEKGYIVLGGKLQLKKEMNRKSGNGWQNWHSSVGKNSPCSIPAQAVPSNAPKDILQENSSVMQD